MPAKTVIRPVESSLHVGLFIDNSFEQNLLREREKREFPKVTLRGAPLCAQLGSPLARPRASSDSASTGCPEGHPDGGLMIRNEIIAAGHPRVVPADQVYAVCEGTLYRFLGVTDKEAAYATLGIAASKPQVFPIDRFWSLLSDRYVYAVVYNQVYPVVKFIYPDAASQLAHR